MLTRDNAEHARVAQSLRVISSGDLGDASKDIVVVIEIDDSLSSRAPQVLLLSTVQSEVLFRYMYRRENQRTADQAK